MVYLLSCGPKPAPVLLNVPYDLTAEIKSHGVILKWTIDRNPEQPISGYNIYLADSAGSNGSLYNSAPYPGDTDGDIARESIEINGLNNGQRYFAYIRTVLPNGRLSEKSEVISFIPLARGTIEISQNYTAGQSGFSFAREKMTAARDFDNDFYIYATDSRMGISSPSRLHSSLRQTLIKIENEPSGQFAETQPLIKGDNYILQLADGGRARLTLLKLVGRNPNIKAIFDYIYYPAGSNK